MLFLSEGSRLAPLSNLHVRVLRMIGYEDKSSFSKLHTTDESNLDFTPAMPSVKRMKMDLVLGPTVQSGVFPSSSSAALSTNETSRAPTSTPATTAATTNLQATSSGENNTTITTKLKLYYIYIILQLY